MAVAGTSLARSSPAQQRWALILVVVLVVLLQRLAPLGFFLYAGACTLVALGTAWLFSTVTTHGLRAERRLSKSLCEIGDVVDVDLRVINGKDLPAPWLYWEEGVDPALSERSPACGLANFDAREHHDASYSVALTRRGLFRLGPAILEACDPLGLVRRFQLRGEADFVTVLPKRVALEAGWPLGRTPMHVHPRRRSFLEDPSRFLGVRDFRPGDSLRRVHWRATARLGRLQSRVYEPTVLDGGLIVLDQALSSYPGLREKGRRIGRHGDIQVPEADPRVELAVTAAASLAAFILDGGQSAGLLSNGADAAERHADSWSGRTFHRLDEAVREAAGRRRIKRLRAFEVPAAKGIEQLRLIRTALARVVPSKGRTLADLLREELPRIPRHLVMTIITPKLDEAFARTVGALRGEGLDVSVIWIRRKGVVAPPVALGDEVPLHAVGDEQELAALGRSRL